MALAKVGIDALLGDFTTVLKWPRGIWKWEMTEGKQMLGCAVHVGILKAEFLYSKVSLIQMLKKCFGLEKVLFFILSFPSFAGF